MTCCRVFVVIAFSVLLLTHPAMSSEDVSGDDPFVEVVATVQKTSTLPNPADIDYPDCLTFVKFTVNAVTKGVYEDSEVLVVLWGIKGFKLLGPAKFKVGDKIKLQLDPFAMYEQDLDTVMRVDDTEDFTSDLYWARQWQLLDGETESLKPANEPEANPLLNSQQPEAVKKILDIVAAHGGSMIGNSESKMLFSSYGYLIQKRFWDLENPTGRDIGVLSAILEFKDYLKTKNIELVVVFPPSALAIYPEVAANVPYNYERDGRIDVEFENFLRELQKNGVNYIDLLPELMSHKWMQGPDGNRYPLYFANDVHWDGAGAWLAGKFVGKAIKKQAWYHEVSASFPPGECADIKPTYSVGVKEQGSYTRNLTDWNYHPAAYLGIGLKPSPNCDFIIKRQNPDSPVWVLGDSFLLGGFYQGISAELSLPCNVLPYGGGSPTSTRQDFARQKDVSQIRLVIWEITAPFLTNQSMWKRVSFDCNNCLDLAQILSATEISSQDITAGMIALDVIKRQGITLSRLKEVSGSTGVGKIIWRSVRLGHDPRFQGFVGLELKKDSEVPFVSVAFEILVNEEVVATKIIDSEYGIRRGWVDVWDVDLGKYQNKTVDFQIRVSPVSNMHGAHFYWGNPILLDADM